MRLLSYHLVLHACQHAQLGLDGDVELVGILHHLLRQGDVLLVGQRASVNHDAGEAHVDAVLTQLEGIAVVEVQHDLRMSAAQLLGIGNGTLGHVAEDGGVGIVTGTL